MRPATRSQKDVPWALSIYTAAHKSTDIVKYSRGLLSKKKLPKTHVESLRIMCQMFSDNLIRPSRRILNVFRGMDLMGPEDVVVNLKYQLFSLNVGDEVHFMKSHFISTSLNPNISQYFANRCCLFKIRIPSHFKFIDVSDWFSGQWSASWFKDKTATVPPLPKHNLENPKNLERLKQKYNDLEHELSKPGANDSTPPRTRAKRKRDNHNNQKRENLLRRKLEEVKDRIAGIEQMVATVDPENTGTTEDEIILPPGTIFKVVKPVYKDKQGRAVIDLVVSRQLDISKTCTTQAIVCPKHTMEDIKTGKCVPIESPELVASIEKALQISKQLWLEEDRQIQMNEQITQVRLAYFKNLKESVTALQDKKNVLREQESRMSESDLQVMKQNIDIMSKQINLENTTRWKEMKEKVAEIKEQYKQHQVVKVENKEQQFYEFSTVQWDTTFKISVMTYNLGLRIQQNRVMESSERSTVVMCQKKYSQMNGWSKQYGWTKQKPTLISQCSENAATFMATVGSDLIGIQEGDYQVVPVLVQHMQTLVDDETVQYALLGKDPIFTIYNKKRLGHGIEFLHKTDMDAAVRSIQAIYFPIVSIVFINAWFNHDVEKAVQEFTTMSFENAFLHKFNKRSSISRVIVCMDSNDGYGFMNEATFKLFGFDVTFPSNQTFETCCRDNEFELQGDYIFDSLYTREKDGVDHIKIPKGGKNEYMSDHFPLVLVD